MPGKLKPSRQAVVDAINNTNELWDEPLTLDAIALGYAQPIEEIAASRNTRLLVYALNGSGLRGTQSITYDRYDFGLYFLNVTVVLFGEPVQFVSQVLPLLNDKYQTDIRKEDIIDVDVSALGEDWVVDVFPRDGNVMWKGSFKLRYARHIRTLDELIVYKALGAIVPPTQRGDKHRAEYIAYSYDFTEMTNTLNSLNIGAQLSEAQIEEMNVASSLNFSLAVPGELPKGAIGLRGATVLRRANVVEGSMYNPGFLRVVVLKLAESSNYAGEIFLHYMNKE